jgi:hypothetical protein
MDGIEGGSPQFGDGGGVRQLSSGSTFKINMRRGSRSSNGNAIPP